MSKIVVHKLPKRPGTEKGLGVVGAWLSPRGKLGGSLPPYLSDTEREALCLVYERLLQFEQDPNAEQWLCEITIKPLRKVKITREVKLV